MSSCNDIAPPPTLADLGITRDQSSQWQKLAALPEREFERRLAAADTENASWGAAAGFQIPEKASPGTAPPPRLQHR